MAGNQRQPRPFDATRAALIIGIVMSSMVTLIILGTSPETPPKAPQSICNGTFSIYGRCQEGASSCTVTSPNAFCTSTITYPTAFVNNPDFKYVTTTGFTGTLTQSAGESAENDLLNTATPTVWTGMPAAQTELLGNINGENQKTVDWTSIQSIAFAVNCVVGSTSATATLQLQYSTDAGLTWNNIATAINIQSTNCPNGGGYATSNSPTAYVTVPAAAQIATLALRVVGQNGAGGADAPSFTKIYVLQKTINTLSANPSCKDATGRGILDPQKTSIKVRCDIAFAEFAGQTTTVTFEWQAWGYSG